MDKEITITSEQADTIIEMCTKTLHDYKIAEINNRDGLFISAKDFELHAERREMALEVLSYFGLEVEYYFAGKPILRKVFN